MTKEDAHQSFSRFSRYLRGVEAFLSDTLSKDDIGDDDYVAGSMRIEFYARHDDGAEELNIETWPNETEVSRYGLDNGRPYHDWQQDASAQSHDANESDSTASETVAYGGGELEDALFNRLLEQRNFNLLVLLGGLGAGKTTTARYLLRRFEERRALIRTHCSCDREICYRKPLYVDFRHLGQSRALRANSVTVAVFREIRLKVYHRLILERCWECSIDPTRIEKQDPEFLVLRRLLIANDLRRFHGDEYQGAVNLTAPDLDLDNDLLESIHSQADMLSLIDRYRRPALAYGQALKALSEDPNQSHELMIHTLLFYLHRCGPDNPLNLMILDNLDQLPTTHIEDLLTELHDVATRAAGLPILVPLRPSSINPYGFIREITYRYHYGPNNFAMILGRLEKYVLARSRTELKTLRSEHKDAPFARRPSDEEIDVLLLLAHAYATIMAAGLSQTSDLSREVHFHSDHAFLRNVGMRRGTAASAAETTDALVGSCCRYAFDLMRRFFANAYESPVLLARTAVGRIGGMVARTQLHYPHLVACLLRDPIGASVSKAANLFRPTRVTSHRSWPTLAKLRILAMLSRDRRLKVRDIVQRLSIYGIPADLAIASLNSLQNKFRLLLWMSTNRPLSVRDEGILEHDVVISEHGERYFRRVLGDFEYIWYCATALNERRYTLSGLKFTIKLHDYWNLIRQLGITEWKQICFERMRSGALEDVSGVGRAERLSVLSVLYSSLSRALLSSEIAVRLYDETHEISTEVWPLLQKINEEILTWQARYRTAFGCNFYLEVYSSELVYLRSAIAHAMRQYGIPDDLRELLSAVHESWSEELAATPAVGVVDPGAPPVEDVIGTIARYGRGIVPQLETVIASLDKERRRAAFFARFLRTREDLRLLLDARLPTYTQVARYTSHLLDDIGATIRVAGETAATSEPLLKWALEEEAFLRNVAAVVGASAYDTGNNVVIAIEEMTEAKRHFNNVINVTESLARNLLVRDASHLAERWR